jgi:tetratricopeptide (TPR) repeat protein
MRRSNAAFQSILLRDSGKRKQVKRLGLLLVILGVPGLVGAAVYYQRERSLRARLAEARATLGSARAGSLLEALAHEHPANAEVHFLRARQLRLERHAEAVDGELAQAAELGWPPAELARERLLLLADTHFLRAEPQLVARLDVEPYDADVILALARGYLTLRYRKRAEALLDRFIAHAPDNGAAYWLRGRLNWEAGREGRYDRARLDLEKALALGPDQYYAAEAQLFLANCLLDLGEHDRALELFRKYVAREPTSIAALLGLAQSAGYAGRLEEALDAYESTLRLRPGNVEALLETAHIYEQRGELTEALRALEAAERSDPKQYKLHSQMAKILRALGQNARAAEYEKRYEEAMKRLAGQGSEVPAPEGSVRGDKPPGG